MLTESQKKDLGGLSVNDRRNALIELFGYEGLPQAWDELEEARAKAPKDASSVQAPAPEPEPKIERPSKQPERPSRKQEKESD